MRERLRNLSTFSFADLNPVALGIVAIAITTAAAVFAFAVGTLGILDSTYTMSGVFDESGGIRGGDKVRYAGVEVGLVTNVRPDFEEGLVVVTWEVDSGTEIGHGANAEIALATLLGGRYIRISGPNEAPYMEDFEEEERRIPLERTRVPIGVQDALGQATTKIAAINVSQVDDLVNQLADLASDNASSFEPLLNDVSALTQTLNGRRDVIDSLLDETNRLTSTLASKDQALVQLIDQAGLLLDEVERRRDQLSTLLGSGSEAARQLDRLIRENRQSLDAILGDLHTTLQATDRSLPELNATLAGLGPALQATESWTLAGPWLDVVGTGAGLVQLADILRALGES